MVLLPKCVLVKLRKKLSLVDKLKLKPFLTFTIRLPLTQICFYKMVTIPLSPTLCIDGTSTNVAFNTQTPSKSIYVRNFRSMGSSEHLHTNHVIYLLYTNVVSFLLYMYALIGMILSSRNLFPRKTLWVPPFSIIFTCPRFWLVANIINNFILLVPGSLNRSKPLNFQTSTR